MFSNGIVISAFYADLTKEFESCQGIDLDTIPAGKNLYQYSIWV